ncbi:HAD family hydrolase [Micropruina glycogenica]|jgi:hydroxymethylpyrimidine pyrophosphatase-like HAD family hydrolase|uniref:HAD-superfamily hydrolase, subfamily IIB n=1 Tax=Micropruina glycogenica TaxID=75385 RepID=A0A2N9JKK2_9ACTN|nr:HAD family hydrolase [Micropruina glycogenica]SPD87939.1 HAD-superfamily hydrolase, subfamily IIB [Micropruina glycogenica]
MTWRPRLVALDIDGTLLDHDGRLPQSVIDSVGRVVAAGVPVALSTGRGWVGTRPLVEALGLPAGQHVSSNGAVRVSYPPLEVLERVTFDPSDVIERVLVEHPEAMLAVEIIGRGFKVNRTFPEGELTGELVTVELGELVAEPVTRVVVRDPSASEDDFIRLAHRLGMDGVSYFIGYTAWLDIAPDGVDKSYGLAGLCADLGIEAADVLALGDGRNDIEMLTWAGRGVALGDAPAEVREAADHVTDRFADGGTARELSRWF